MPPLMNLSTTALYIMNTRFLIVQCMHTSFALTMVTGVWTQEPGGSNKDSTDFYCTETIILGPRMPFCFHYGLSLMCLTILFTQVCPQYDLPRSRSPSGPIPSCCMKANNATIKEPVNACYVHEEHTFPLCKIHAYILSTNNGDRCVDPRAWWLQQRLKRLERRGIYCQIL
ncbi:uncharacterized protein LOC144535971 [Sander vitreus]